MDIAASNDPPNVHLVAGNRLLREALTKLLTKKGNCRVSGVSDCLLEVASTISASGATVLILDSVTAGDSNASFISEVTSQIAGLKVILIDMDDDPTFFLQCIRAGALGYLLSDASSAEVVSGVHAVARGESVCPSRLLIHLFRAFSHQCVALPGPRIKLELGLTRRQQQLVPLICQGLTNKEIGSRLGISEQTVKNHVHDIMRRIGVNDRLQVMNHAYHEATLQ
jgi:two-component system nitrate/nitrite response regulator NarL